MAECLWRFEISFFLIIPSLLIVMINTNTAGAFQVPLDLDLIFRRDVIRHRTISQKISVIKPSQRLQSITNTVRRKILDIRGGGHDDNNYLNVSMEMPMHSGADKGIGQYLVTLKAGTPSQKFMLIVDTGSDLTWMNCKYGCKSDDTNNCSDSTRGSSVFQADNSSSFTTIPCSSDMCKVQLANLFSLTLCPSLLTPCAYNYSYSDGSSAMGLFAKETITVGLTNGRKTKLDNVLIGCSESSQGQSFQRAAADGVLGLGFSKSSFAIKATKQFGGKFSYCFVDHLSPQNISTYLSFGSSKRDLTSMRYTTLGAIDSFYAANVRGLSVEGVMLNIPREIWDVNGVGGTIIDSGSSLTYLTLPAYEPVVAALQVSLAKFERLNLKIGPMQFCFNSTGFDENFDVPRLSFHFDDGALFEPPVKSYVIDAAEGVRCLGFVPTDWPGISVIGNIMQQNHLWEFDLIGGNLGFAPSGCT